MDTPNGSLFLDRQLTGILDNALLATGNAPLPQHYSLPHPYREDVLLTADRSSRQTGDDGEPVWTARIGQHVLHICRINGLFSAFQLRFHCLARVIGCAN